MTGSSHDQDPGGESRADIYDSPAVGGVLTRARTLTNPSAHLHESELASDSPGRVFKRTGGVHQSYGERHALRDRATDQFARDVAAVMVAEVTGEACRGVVMIAAPRLANRLSRLLPPGVRMKVRGVIAKDLAHLAPSEIRPFVRQALRAGELH